MNLHERMRSNPLAEVLMPDGEKATRLDAKHHVGFDLDGLPDPD